MLNDSGLTPSKIKFVLCTPSGGIDNVGFSSQDVDYLSKKRQTIRKKICSINIDIFQELLVEKSWIFSNMRRTRRRVFENSN